MPRGGARPGGGRKPMPNSVRSLRKARADVGATVLNHPSAAPPLVPTTNEPSSIEEFEAPNDLQRAERAIWLKQAPHAFRNRTLIRATALSFERYCRIVVMERDEAKSSGRGGPNHRGLLNEINKLELQFKLTASGSSMREAAPLPVPVAPSASRLSRFRS